MSIERFQALFSYSDWANRRLFETMEGLSQDQLTAAGNLYHGAGSIRATFAHVLSAEEVWLERCHGREPLARLSEEELPDLGALRRRAESISLGWRSFMSSLGASDLDQIVSNTSRSGRTFTHPLWVRLSQTINHSTQHRSEVALVLTGLGHSPGDLDFLTYFESVAASSD